jgi:hypothetical protein
MGIKVKIINLLKRPVSQNISEKFDVRTSNTSNRKKNSELIQNFFSVLESENGGTIRKAMKKAENGKVEAALYQWFIQKGQLDNPFQGRFCVKKPSVQG